MNTFLYHFICVDEVACADPELCNQICGNPSGCYNMAFPLFVMRLLPAGKEFCSHLL